MPTYDVAMSLLKLTWAAFVFALGACAGSLTNVIVYRMPRGISIVTPPSRCPACATKLSWRDNIPVFGWVFLGGRCRYCKARISPEYPLVELAVALLFTGFYALWFWVPRSAGWFEVGLIRPEWTLNDARMVWPSFIVLLALLGSLAAMTIVDAKTFTIPLALTWFPAVVAILIHPIHAAWVEFGTTQGRLTHHAPGEVWSLATPGRGGWTWIGASIGGAIGIGISSLLLLTGTLKRSFADYEEWEKQALAKGAPGSEPAAPAPQAPGGPAPAGPSSEPATPEGGTSGPSAAPNDAQALEAAEQAELWIQYPHARREVLRELLFLAPCLLLGFVGWKIGEHVGAPWEMSPITGRWIPSSPAPLWLTVLAGVLMGYLIGGGVVWAVRIFGSLAFGKEAMGMGDVHLMAGVGACLGWIDSTLAFFMAAFVGVFWAVVSRMFSGRLARQMPYGPFLAIATILVLLAKPALEALLGRLTGTGSVNLP